MKQHHYEFDVFEYINQECLFKKPSCKEEKIQCLEKMGFTINQTNNGRPIVEYDCNQFARYLSTCIVTVQNENYQLYIYSNKGIYKECNKDMMGKIIKFLMNQVHNVWTVKREESGLAAYKRGIMKIVKQFNLSDEINLSNGVLTIDSLQLRVHSSNIYSTVQIPLNYDAEAKCPRFIKYLEEITNNDIEVQKVLQELLGYCLSDSTKAEKAFFLYGNGCNGKSIFAKTVEYLIGKENISAVTLSNLNSDFGMESMAYSKVNISAENELKGNFSSENLKAAISGDVVSIRRKYKTDLQVALTCKIVMLMNTLPNVSDVTYGFFRKIIIIPFNRKFSDKEKDINLFDKLLIEMPGILNFALEGLKRLQKNNYQFTKSKAIDKLMENYKKVQNPTIEFFNDTYAKSDDDCIKRSDIYYEFLQWAESKGYDKISRSIFWSKLNIASKEDSTSILLTYKKIRGYEFLCGYKRKYPENWIVNF